LADDDAAFVVLQGRRYDLAGAGAVAVDQAGDRHLNEIALGPSSHGRALPTAILDRDDLTLVQEQVGHLAGPGQYAAGIEAKIEDQSLEAVPLESRNDAGHVSCRSVREGRQADVADLVLRIEPVVPRVVRLAFDTYDRFQLDHCPRDLDFSAFGF